MLSTDESAPKGANPFDLKVPPFAVVLGGLIAYFILVGPASHFILRRLNRQSAYWITGPALSLLFAGGFAVFALDLLRVDAAHRTFGTLLASLNGSEAVFVGASEAFLPRRRPPIPRRWRSRWTPELPPRITRG